ncbi:MAG: alpha/beta fold hydrolase [Chitinophagales bacterium]
MDVSQIKVPSVKRLLLEPLGVSELVNVIPAWSLMESLPRGNGEPVMVVPGLTTNDLSTKIVRSFLNYKGFTAYGWELGFNLTYNEKLEKKLIARVDELYEKHQQKITLIGWSLGGITIRILAKHAPEKIKQVISLGAPFTNIKGKTYVSWWGSLVARQRVKNFNEVWTREAAEQPLMPSTSIYSKNDGMVSWQYCIDWETGPKTQNIEVYCNHLGFGMTPTVWAILVDRLLQSEENWQLFDESKLIDIEKTTVFHV